jgi:hypothetical protein
VHNVSEDVIAQEMARIVNAKLDEVISVQQAHGTVLASHTRILEKLSDDVKELKAGVAGMQTGIDEIKALLQERSA